MIRIFLAIAAAAPPPLHFDHLPLGSAARVLSARFHAQITILAQAAAPITGDFAQLTLAQALALVAAQAGLEVRKDDAGFVIGPKLLQAAPPNPDGTRAIAGRASSAADGTSAISGRDSPAPNGSGATSGRAGSSAEQRAALLRQRAELLRQAAKLSAP